MNKNPFRRLYKISLGSAIFISIPVFILIIWIIFSSYLDFKKYMNRIEKLNPSLTLPFTNDIMHLYVKNKLKQLYIKARATDMPSDDGLDFFEITIPQINISKLNANLPQSGKSTFYRAYVRYKGKSYTLKIRYVGDNNWHWLYPKKSYKIKTKKANLIEGARRINIKIPRWLWILNEPVSTDLAKQVGLISPRVFPIKVILNNVYMGLYFFQDPIDESVLRRHRLMPGSVYSGDFGGVDPITGISMLWKNPDMWEKDASRNFEQEGYRRDIVRLIQSVNRMNLKEFYNFCINTHDNEYYSRYVSLDNAIGCQHHDFAHNHKIYFDPYRGKYFPIYWDAGELSVSNKKLDIIGNPFLNKWKLIPEFDLLRQKTLYRLINDGVLNSENIINLIDKYDKLVRPALKADIFRMFVNRKRTSILKFPPSSPSEPFFMSEYDRMVLDFKLQIKQRIEMIKRYLSKSELLYNVKIQGRIKILKILTSNSVGGVLKKIKVSCKGNRIRLYRDINRNCMLDSTDLLLSSVVPEDGKAVFNLKEEILPGYKKVKRPDRSVKLAGRFELHTSPLEYIYLFESDGEISKNFILESSNIITGKNIRLKRSSYPPSITKQTLSLHPWDMPAPPQARTITWGPGKVELKKTVIFSPHQTLVIKPGTRIYMDKKVSIFCFGKVIAKGEKNYPITFQALEKSIPWGGFVLQGNATSNSFFEHCKWKDGSLPSRILIDYSGMVSIHDTSNIVFKECTFGINHVGDDTLHYAYASGLIKDCHFSNAKSDAFDVDISRVDIKSSIFKDCGNDGLDFMTSSGNVEGCLFINCGDKGASVGEESQVFITNNIFRRCKIGIEVKDKSIVNLGTNLITGSDIAINLYKKNWRYGEGGALNAKTIHVTNCNKDLATDKHSKLINKDMIIKRTKPDSSFFEKIVSDTELQREKIQK